MLDGYKISDSACFACSMCCGNICLVKQGKYIGTVTEGPEYETCAMLGSNLGIENFAAVLKASQLCDEYGIDTISTGNLIGAVIEGYEKGILTLDDLDGKPISWGDEDAILDVIRKIAYREGLGDTEALLDSLERAYADRSPDAAYMPALPDLFLEELESQPRFLALMAAMDFGDHLKPGGPPR